MFYDKFLSLCAQKGVSKTAACVNAGLSETAWKRWVNGGVPNSVSMAKLCEYFGIPIEQMYNSDSPIIPVDEEELARQEAFSNQEMRILFDAARNIPASKIYEVVAQLRKYKEENGIDS